MLEPRPPGRGLSDRIFRSILWRLTMTTSAPAQRSRRGDSRVLAGMVAALLAGCQVLFPQERDPIGEVATARSDADLGAVAQPADAQSLV